MESATQLSEALARLPDYLAGHVLVSLAALALGLTVSLPLGVAAARRPKFRAGLLGAASVIQTIPGLALLTLFYPLLLALGGLSERLFGATFSALGFLPAMLALALYSMLPVMRNTATGLGAITDAVKDAARAIGLTPRQRLWLVEIPIALPVIMAGIRTAAVWVIGTATLSTPIGQTSLGNYIFAGLQTQNWVFVLFGCAAAATLAITIDQLLALIERGLSTHNRARVIGGLCGLAIIVMGALLPGAMRPHASQASYVIGTKPFSEQYVLAALIERRLEASGLRATRREGLGSGVIFNALAAGEIDVYVDYSGTLWANQMQRSETPSRNVMVNEIGVWLNRQYGISLLGPLGFENAYALVTKSNRFKSISDLTDKSGEMTIAGDYEFFARPEWRNLRETYGLNFRGQRQMQAEFMYPALADGQVDVIAGYTSDGQIVRFGLTVLQDPKSAIPPYDALLLVSPKRAADEKFITALKPLINAITVEAMREANRKAAEGMPPAAVAKSLAR
ncbi:MAG: ABC transporter permease/substrate-binding protein [Pseudolabrys sp.]|nr:ABC transporter permease/substrate-binding protein [Pseudolabrys sp.]